MTFVPPDDPPTAAARLGRWLTRPAWLALRGRRSPAPPAHSIDIERPSLFTAYPRVPDPADHVAEVRRRVTELFRSHAIDEGTPRILDGSIDAVADMWKGQVQLEHLERARAAAFEIARLEARAAIRAERIAELEKRLQRTEAALGAAGQAGSTSAERMNPKGERS